MFVASTSHSKVDFTHRSVDVVFVLCLFFIREACVCLENIMDALTKKYSFPSVFLQGVALFDFFWRLDDVQTCDYCKKKNSS